MLSVVHNYYYLFALLLIHSLRTSICLLIFIHAFRHFRWPGGRGQWSCLFRGPHQLQGHFPQPWNFTNFPWKLIYLSGWSWFQFSIMAWRPLWKKLTSGKYISLFLILLLNIYIRNLKNYVTTGRIFEEIIQKLANQRKLRKWRDQMHHFFIIIQMKTPIT